MVRYLTIGLICGVVLTGCYEFRDPAFNPSESVPLLKTPLLEPMLKLPTRNIGNKGSSKTLKTDGSDRVYEAGNGMYWLEQKTKNGNLSYHLRFSSHEHIFLCAVMDGGNSLKEFPSLGYRTKDEMFFKTITVIGKPADMRKALTAQLQRSEKYCVAAPL